MEIEVEKEAGCVRAEAVAPAVVKMGMGLEENGNEVAGVAKIPAPSSPPLSPRRETGLGEGAEMDVEMDKNGVENGDFTSDDEGGDGLSGVEECDAEGVSGTDSGDDESLDEGEVSSLSENGLDGDPSGDPELKKKKKKKKKKKVGLPFSHLWEFQKTSSLFYSSGSYAILTEFHTIVLFIVVREMYASKVQIT